MSPLLLFAKALKRIVLLHACDIEGPPKRDVGKPIVHLGNVYVHPRTPGVCVLISYPYIRL